MKKSLLCVLRPADPRRGLHPGRRYFILRCNVCHTYLV